MITLTAGGSFADAFTRICPAQVLSTRDLGEQEFFRQLREAGAIVNNAASVQCGGGEMCLSRNFDFTRKLVAFLEAHHRNVPFTHLSSMSVLDTQSERRYLDPVAMTPYGFSKYLAEVYCLRSALSRLKALRFSTLFYRNPAKDGLSRLIFDAVTKGEVTIYDGGAATRDFLPLRVAAEYARRITALPASVPRVFNVASGRQVSFFDIVCILKELLGNVTVNDIRTNAMSPVLAAFDVSPLREVGLVEFDLRTEIQCYIAELRTS